MKAVEGRGGKRLWLSSPQENAAGRRFLGLRLKVRHNPLIDVNYLGLVNLAFLCSCIFIALLCESPYWQYGFGTSANQMGSCRSCFLILPRCHDSDMCNDSDASDYRVMTVFPPAASARL